MWGYRRKIVPLRTETAAKLIQLKYNVAWTFIEIVWCGIVDDELRRQNRLRFSMQ